MSGCVRSANKSASARRLSMVLPEVMTACRRMLKERQEEISVQQSQGDDSMRLQLEEADIETFLEFLNELDVSYCASKI